MFMTLLMRHLLVMMDKRVKFLEPGLVHGLRNTRGIAVSFCCVEYLHSDLVIIDFCHKAALQTF